MGFKKDLYGISMIFLEDFFGTAIGFPLKFLWDFYGGSMICLWDFYWIPVRFSMVFL